MKMTVIDGILEKAVEEGLNKINIGEQWITEFGIFEKTGEKEVTLRVKIESLNIDSDAYIKKAKEIIEHMGWTYKVAKNLKQATIVSKNEDLNQKDQITEIFVLTTKDGDDIHAYETISAFAFTNEEDAKKVAEEFEKRNQRLDPIRKKDYSNRIKQGLIYVKTKAGNSMNGLSRRKWGYRKLHVCNGMSPDDMNRKFPMFTEPEWIVDDKN